MSQLLDLSITFDPPPTEAAPEIIASITLRCEALGLTLPGGLLTDPITRQEREELLWYLEEYWKWPFYEFAEGGKQVEELLADIGKRLYQAVFGHAMSIVEPWRLQPGMTRQVSIISAIPRVLSLPWELLHDEHGFLVMHTREPISILRRLPQKQLPELIAPFEPPLRILLVTARPTGTGFMDPRGVARELLDEVQGQVQAGVIALEFLHPPTLPALRKRLQDTTRPVHLLHFDGHGTFEGQVDGHDGLRKAGGGKGKLAFEDADGKLDLVDAGTLAQVLLDSGVRLAVLDACQSAMGGTDHAFSSVATRLIQGGVDAVIAMSASVLVAATTRYFEAFYRELTPALAPPNAQERARQALHDTPQRHVMRLRRDDEGTPVRLQDWWLPHFYQQRPLVLQGTRPSGPLKQEALASPERLNQDMPTEPR